MIYNKELEDDLVEIKGLFQIEGIWSNKGPQHKMFLNNNQL